MGIKNSKQDSQDFNPNQWVDVTKQYQQPNPKFGTFRIVKNLHTKEVADKYEDYFDSTKDYEDYLHAYQWRRNEDYVVPACYLHTKNANRYCSRSYAVDIYIEHPKNRLSDFNDIPFPDTMYVLKAMLSGYSKLFDSVGAFPVAEEQVCIDQLGIVKVWLNKNLSKNYPEDWEIQSKQNLPSNEQETQLVRQIIQVVHRNSDPQCNPKLSFLQIFDQNCRKRKMGFTQALGMITPFVTSNNKTLPDNFVSVVDVYNDQHQLFEENDSRMQYSTGGIRFAQDSNMGGSKMSGSRMGESGMRESKISLRHQDSRASQIDNLNKRTSGMYKRSFQGSNANKGQSYRLSNLSQLQQQVKRQSHNRPSDPEKLNPQMKHFVTRQNVRVSQQNMSHIQSSINQPHTFEPERAYVPCAPGMLNGASLIANSRSGTNLHGSQFNGSQFNGSQFNGSQYQANNGYIENLQQIGKVGHTMRTQNSNTNRTNSSQQNHHQKMPQYPSSFQPSQAYRPINPLQPQKHSSNQYKMAVNNSISEQPDEYEQSNYNGYNGVSNRRGDSKSNAMKYSGAGEEFALSWANDKYERELEEQVSAYRNSKAVSINNPNYSGNNSKNIGRRNADSDANNMAKSERNNRSLYRGSVQSNNVGNASGNILRSSHNSNSYNNASKTARQTDSKKTKRRRSQKNQHFQNHQRANRQTNKPSHEQPKVQKSYISHSQSQSANSQKSSQRGQPNSRKNNKNYLESSQSEEQYSNNQIEKQAKYNPNMFKKPIMNKQQNIQANNTQIIHSIPSGGVRYGIGQPIPHYILTNEGVRLASPGTLYKTNSQSYIAGNIPHSHPYQSFSHNIGSFNAPISHINPAQPSMLLFQPMYQNRIGQPPGMAIKKSFIPPLITQDIIVEESFQNNNDIQNQSVNNSPKIKTSAKRDNKQINSPQSNKRRSFPENQNSSAQKPNIQAVPKARKSKKANQKSESIQQVQTFESLQTFKPVTSYKPIQVPKKAQPYRHHLQSSYCTVEKDSISIDPEIVKDLENMV